MKAKKSDITCHRDGDVTYWSVYHQGWERCPATKIEDRELAAMSPEERERVEKHRRRHGGRE